MFQTAIPVIQVSGSVAAQEFYCKGLGFALVSSWRPDETIDDPRYMTLARDGAQLHVHSFQSGMLGAGAVYMLVDHVDALHADLMSRGVAVSGPPIDQTWGTREIVVRDPDRNAVTFGQRLTQPRLFSLHGVRYQVTDVARAAAFYTNHLGFKVEHQQLPAFASLSLGEFRLLLSGPGASGSRRMPGGESQQPGGWNRVVLGVADLPSRIDALKQVGVKFRNQLEAGPAGRQIQIEDPDGNPIELFESAR